MPEAILDALGPVLTRWAMGASAVSSAPGAWAAVLAADPAEAELRLLALSGQYLGIAVVAEPQGRLRTLPDVPTLALPTMPAALRPLAQRVLRVAQGPARGALPHFLAARGWTTHPADWMPSANDEDAPEIYSSWRDWAAAAVSGEVRAARSAHGLTAENWADHWPAERKAALAELRARDPDAARALLEAKLAAEGAEARFRLLGVMTAELSDSDAPFLEALAAGDRAPKVKAFAASLLARLGRGGGGEDVEELAGFFSVQAKGVLRRTRAIRFIDRMTAARVQRRGALFEQVDAAAFAAALGFEEDALIEAWPWETDRHADGAFVAMIARSGSDALVAQAVERVSQGGGVAAGGLALLAPRLTPGQRAGAAARLLRSSPSGFAAALDIARGFARIDDPLATPAGARLLAVLAKAEARPGDGADELLALGLLASNSGARRALDRLHRIGLLQADPRLDMIRLNAALEDRGGTG